MRFLVSCHLATVGMGDWFAGQGSFQTCFDKTFLELLAFFADTAYAAAMSALVHPLALSALSKIYACIIVLRLALFLEIISRHAARAVSLKSTP